MGQTTVPAPSAAAEVAASEAEVVASPFASKETPKHQGAGDVLAPPSDKSYGKSQEYLFTGASSSHVQELNEKEQVDEDTEDDKERESYKHQVDLEAITSPKGSSESSEYWDPHSMSPLSTKSLAAVARLRQYRPPAFPLWNQLPASRRAAVLILLYPDRVGDLRVVLTMRASGMRNFGGHAAFPGGKADTTSESPYEIARREAWEEIGLPETNDLLPKNYDIEFLCHLPHSLARTDVVVRPCVALLNRRPPPPASSSTEAVARSLSSASQAAVSDTLRPTPSAGEVAAVFSGPFHNFLLSHDETPSPALSTRARLPPGPWYEGGWGEHVSGAPWRIHNFYVPITNQRVTKPAPVPVPSMQKWRETVRRPDVLEEHWGRYKVWGFTAKILVEAARVAYDESPQKHLEAADHLGDEALVLDAASMGRFYDRKRQSESLVGAQPGLRGNSHMLRDWRDRTGGQEAKM
ncbi:Peroxisomal coenzyme A diphosphatase 1, peroxisomal [Ceratocystis lukuohia]|uniref:Peroxisomal coenzyme A diphosphatase 1, peroxisomal n=1 Tax=Ceratocystis lukuohia TaxID=2019550 RepID=A0ABR4MEJ0_9PEZI